jgi:general secretion pathway protein G
MALGFEADSNTRYKNDFVETMFLRWRFYSIMKIAMFACATVLVFCGCDRISGGTSQPRVKGDMNSISSVVKMYKINNGHFPSTAQGLQALVARPTGDPQPMSWTQLADKVPLDPWGQEYRYECILATDGERQKDRFRIISKGKDITLGTDDDMVHEDSLPEAP